MFFFLFFCSNAAQKPDNTKNRKLCYSTLRSQSLCLDGKPPKENEKKFSINWKLFSVYVFIPNFESNWETKHESVIVRLKLSVTLSTALYIWIYNGPNIYTKFHMKIFTCFVSFFFFRINSWLTEFIFFSFSLFCSCWFDNCTHCIISLRFVSFRFLLIFFLNYKYLCWEIKVWHYTMLKIKRRCRQDTQYIIHFSGSD